MTCFKAYGWPVHIFKIRFVNLIGKSAYESAKRIRNIILKQKENIISGLDEI